MPDLLDRLKTGSGIASCVGLTRRLLPGPEHPHGVLDAGAILPQLMLPPAPAPSLLPEGASALAVGRLVDPSRRGDTRCGS